jgi:uncharacterized protein (TIGR02391 family)
VERPPVYELSAVNGNSLRFKCSATADLADAALALGKHGMPLLAFNTLRTDSEISEQNGLLNLVKGLFGTFRNPAAHAPKISWNMTEPDALDLLTMASFIHRRLDNAARTPRTVTS